MCDISIVIPCRNEKQYISKCLDSFIESDFDNDNMEILVIDGESDDGTIDIANNYSEKYKFIKLISNKKRLTPFALNLGVLNAKNEYILIASAHSSFPKNYISKLLQKIVELNADGIGGQLITKVKNENKKSLSIIKVLSNKFGVGNSMFRLGVEEPTLVDTVPFGIYKKELFNEIGFYREDLIRNHDIEWSKRLISAKKKIYLIPDVSCNYYARETFSKLAKNNYGNGKWNLLTVYITKNFSSLSIRHFIPLFFLLSLIIPLILSIFYFPIILLAALSLLSHFVLITLISIKERDSKSSFLNILFAFYTLHLSYGFGSLIGLLMIDKLFTKKSDLQND